MARVLTFRKKVVYLIAKLVWGIIFSFLVFHFLVYVLSLTGVVNSNYFAREIDEFRLSGISNDQDLKKYLDEIKYDYIVYDDQGNELFGKYLDNEFKKLVLVKDNQQYIGSVIAHNYYNLGERQLQIRVPEIPEFTSHTIRKFLDFNTFTYIVIFLQIIFVTILLLIRFFRQIEHEFQLVQNIIQKDEDAPRSKREIKIQEFRNTADQIVKMQDSLKKLVENEQDMRKQLNFQISALAHDIKTPLTVIKGNAKLINLPNEYLKENQYLRHVLDGATTIDEYVDVMITYTKLIYFDDKTELIRVAELIDSVLAEVSGYNTKNINVLLEIEADSEQIYCQAFQLKRAMINILVNAYDYARSTIRIHVYVEDDYVCFSVWNDGSSFSEEAIKNIGSVFYMGQKNRAVGKHYGLGLYFVNEVAKKHNGKLFVQNKNGGAEIVVKLDSKISGNLH